MSKGGVVLGGGNGPLFLVPSLWSHGLLIVDYILLSLSLSLLEEGKDLAGGLILPVPICFFHHFFVHLLRHHCRRGPWEASRRFLTMGIAVSTVSPRRSVHSCSMSRCNRYIVVYFHLAGVMHADWASHFGYLAYLNDVRHCLELLIVSCYSMFSLLFEPQVLLIKVLLMMGSYTPFSYQHLCKSQSLNMWSTSWPHWKTFMCSEKDEIFNCDVMFFTLETKIESARNTKLRHDSDGASTKFVPIARVLD
ncbi:unnamed protein product [Musa hybrid cultivar]